MREIKFRIRNLSTDIFEDLARMTICIDDKGIEIYTLDGDLLEDYEINQYTGLKDISGKEIYEGDIVQRNMPGGVKFIGKVIFHESSFMIDNSKYKTHLFSYIDEITIKGNIYENPDLLEGVNHD